MQRLAKRFRGSGPECLAIRSLNQKPGKFNPRNSRVPERKQDLPTIAEISNQKRRVRLHFKIQSSNSAVQTSSGELAERPLEKRLTKLASFETKTNLK